MEVEMELSNFSIERKYHKSLKYIEFQMFIYSSRNRSLLSFNFNAHFVSTLSDYCLNKYYD